MTSITCMEKYKNNFAIEFAKIMEEKLPEWKKKQKENQKNLYTTDLNFYLGSFLCGFIPGKNEREYNIKTHFYTALILVIITIIIEIQVENKDYQKAVKESFYSDILKVFGNIEYNKRYKSKEIHMDQIIDKSNYTKSCLFSHPVSYANTDDCFCGIYNDVKFKVNETDFNWEKINPEKRFGPLKLSDKTKQDVPLFKGIAMYFKMNKDIKSRVLILSKFSKIEVPQGYEKVELEYKDFTKKYDVWVEKGDQVEARYLLNVAFIERFVQLQTSFRVNKMCASVYGDEMLVLLSTKKDLFEMNHLFCNIADIHQYDRLFDQFASVLSFIDVLNLSSKTGL